MVSYPLKPKSNQQKTAEALARSHGVVMVPGMSPDQWPRIAPGGHFDPVHPMHAQVAGALSGLLANAAANPGQSPMGGLLAPAQPQPPMQGLLAVGPAGASAPAPATKRRAVKSAPKKTVSKTATKRAVVKRPKTSTRRGRGR